MKENDRNGKVRKTKAKEGEIRVGRRREREKKER